MTNAYVMFDHRNFRAFSHGPDQTFTTDPECTPGGALPTARTLSPARVKLRGATLRGTAVTQGCTFVYQFEVLCRNRLGYDGGVRAMAADPFYDADWKSYVEFVRRQVGFIDFADLVYLRSELYVTDQRRQTPDYQPPVPPLFKVHPLLSDSTDQAFSRVFADLLILYRRVFEQLVFAGEDGRAATEAEAAKLPV